MSPPRLIFVNRVYRPSQAATAQLLTDLAEGLAARGWPVHVIAAGAGDGEQAGVTIHRTGPGERHAGLVSRVLNYRRFRREAAHRLATLVRPGDIVVPMTDPPMLGAALHTVAHRSGAHLVHWIQDVYPEILAAHAGPVVALPLWPLRRQRDDAWRAADRCVALGTAMADAVAQRGVPADRIAVIPNWAPRELEIPPPAAAVAARRAAWGVADQFVVAYSGNLGRVHEFAAIIAAAERLQANGRIVFQFIGAGARYAEVRAAATARGLANVRFLPPEPRDQLAAALSAADVHLVTLRPGFARLVYPSKLAGALAAGRPVLFVGPPDGEIPQLLAHARCGAAFAPGEGGRLAETLAAWAADPGLCASLGREARTAYEQRFTFAAALAQWEAMLTGVATRA